MPEELDVMDQVRSEYDHIINCQQSGGNKTIAASDLSKVADDFVGKSIKKNYDPIHGRFVLLKQFGMDLQNKCIHLKPNEVVPGRHLMNLFSNFGA